MIEYKTNDELIDSVVDWSLSYLHNSKLVDKRVADVMRKIDRSLFIPSEVIGESYQANPYVNVALPINFDQTCSQPSMVAFMADSLKLRPGLNVLEIGTGCGYSAAITERLIYPGKLTTVEIISLLAEEGKKNVVSVNSDLKERNIEFVVGDGSKGYKSNAPYDRIYLTAGVMRGFDEDMFKEQLKEGGILIYPETYGNLYVLTLCNGSFKRKSYSGVVFVKLVEGKI